MKINENVYSDNSSKLIFKSVHRKGNKFSLRLDFVHLGKVYKVKGTLDGFYVNVANKLDWDIFIALENAINKSIMKIDHLVSINYFQYP